MIRPDWRVLVVGLNFVHLHELMELRFGILDGPIAVNAGIHIQRFGLFHSLLLLRPVNETMPSRSWVVVIIMIRSICLSHGLGPIAMLELRSAFKACCESIEMKELTWKTGAEMESGIRAGSAPPPSRASAGTSFAFNWPVRTRKLTKSLAAFFSASFFVVEFPAPTYAMPGIRTSHKNRVRCLGPKFNYNRFSTKKHNSPRTWFLTSWAALVRGLFTRFGAPFIEKWFDVRHFHKLINICRWFLFWFNSINSQFAVSSSLLFALQKCNGDRY